MKKIEILIESIRLNSVIEILEKQKVEGYTVLGNITGKGPNGVNEHNCKAKVFENTYLFSVCSEAKAEKVLEQVSKLLRYYSGACFISNIEQLHI